MKNKFLYLVAILAIISGLFYTICRVQPCQKCSHDSNN